MAAPWPAWEFKVPCSQAELPNRCHSQRSIPLPSSSLPGLALCLAIVERSSQGPGHPPSLQVWVGRVHSQASDLTWGNALLRGGEGAPGIGRPS